MLKLKAFVVLACLCIYFFVLGRMLTKVANREVKPYKFADIPNQDGVYKLIHNGCEVFIVRSNGSDSITLGRGCK